jgi:hypothetical protein
MLFDSVMNIPVVAVLTHGALTNALMTLTRGCTVHFNVCAKAEQSNTQPFSQSKGETKTISIATSTHYAVQTLERPIEKESRKW